MKNLNFLLFCFLAINSVVVKAQTSCRTPNGEVAKCIPINTCSLLYDVVTTRDPDVIKFLQASQCGFNRTPLVCCGSTASYTREPEVRNNKPPTKGTGRLPGLNECGEQLLDSKILNGQDTAPEEFPWTALINYRNGTGFEQFSCGGTIINERYIVTAAHCVKGRILTAVGSLKNVRLGEWNTETDPDCYGSGSLVKVCTDKPVDYDIEEAIAHSEYSDTSRDRYHDIALIRLNRPIQYTNYIRPVCLPESTDQVQIRQRLHVVGWGKTETGRYSAIKQKLLVPIVANTECRQVFNRANVNVQTTQLCAGGEKDKDSCNGDSGGPLLAERSNRFFLEGIVSFGAKCGQKGWPGIYTRVAAYRDWIESNIRA